MTKEEIALNNGLCSCDEAYKSRGMTAPDCPYHAFAIEEAMDQWKDQETERLRGALRAIELLTISPIGDFLAIAEIQKVISDLNNKQDDL